MANKWRKALLRYPAQFGEHRIDLGEVNTFDVGLDMSFLNGRLAVSGDWYQRNTYKSFRTG